MAVLEIPYSHRHLMSREPIFRLYWDIFEKQFVELHDHQNFPVKEVHDWLIETIGDEVTSFRELDRGYFEHRRSSIDTIKIDDENTWDMVNPRIPEERRTWKVVSSGLYFRESEHAVLFKLRWF